MRSLPLAKAVVVWLAILVVAVANGALRESLLAPRWGRVPAQVASGVLLCAGVMAAAWIADRWMEHLQASAAWALGGLWLVLTVAFEFTLGRLVLQRSWAELVGAYAFEGGNLWPLVLATTLLAPPLVAALASSPRSGSSSRP